jgi:hypothetical protein
LATTNQEQKLRLDECDALYSALKSQFDETTKQSKQVAAQSRANLEAAERSCESRLNTQQQTHAQAQKTETTRIINAHQRDMNALRYEDFASWITLSDMYVFV